ncbi:fungal-specific transcription factor domain-containing protein [Dipodascopsis uninucleata]
MEKESLKRSSSPHKAIKRRRKITICLSCYKRRVKCDKEKPQCSQCVALRIPCEYADSFEKVYNNETSLSIESKKERTDDREVGLFSIAQNRDSTLYSSASHWASILQQDSKMASLLKPLNEFESQPENQQQFKRIIETYLPPQKECDDLIDEYLRTMHPFIPILDPNYIKYEYRLFWETVYSPEPKFTSFVCVLFSLLFSASVSRNEQNKYSPELPCIRKENLYAESMEKYRTAVDMTLAVCEFPKRPSIPCLLAGTIVQTSLRRDAVVDTVVDITILVRVAQIMGLHRDPEMFASAKLDPSEIDLRRRLWWQLYYIDVTGSLVNGLPSSTQTTQFDVKLPSEDIKSAPDRLIRLLHNGRIMSSRLFGKQLQDVYGVRRPSKQMLRETEDNLISFRQTMIEKIDALDSIKFDMNSTEYSCKEMLALQRYGSLTLKLLLEKGTLFYYRVGILGTPIPPGIDPLVELRKKTVSCAISVIEDYLEYSSFPEYVQFIWSCRTFNQFHAAAVLLGDIYRYPNESFGKPDRRIQVVKDCINRTRYLRLNDVSSSSDWQLRVLLRYADLVWREKLCEIPEFANAANREDPALNHASSDSDPVTMQDSKDTENKSLKDNTISVAQTGQSLHILPGATRFQQAASHQDASRLMTSNSIADSMSFNPMIEFLPSDIDGNIGNPISLFDGPEQVESIMQQLLNVDLWEYNWKAYGFNW